MSPKDKTVKTKEVAIYLALPLKRATFSIRFPNGEHHPPSEWIEDANGEPISIQTAVDALNACCEELKVLRERS